MLVGAPARAASGVAALPRHAGRLRTADGAATGSRSVRAVGRRAAAGRFAPLGAPAFAAAGPPSGSSCTTTGSVTRSLPRCRPTKRAESTARWRETLVARRADDPETLFEHYDGAGERERASIQAALAASKANAALAFDRAGFFYRRALDLAPGRGRRSGWKQGLASALANAGRPADAGSRLSRRRRRRGAGAADRAAAACRRTIPDRRAHRSGPRRDSHGARRRPDASGARPAHGAGVAGLQARPASMARSGFRGARRGPRRRGRSPSHRHLLGGRDRAHGGGQHSRGRFPDPPPDARAGCGGAVPDRPRAGDRGDLPRLRQQPAAAGHRRRSRNGPRRCPNDSIVRTPSRCRPCRRG